MGLFVYTQKGSIISMVDLPTTEIIEPIYLLQNYRAIFYCTLIIVKLSEKGLKKTEITGFFGLSGLEFLVEL